jgi:hypothetical protein
MMLKKPTVGFVRLKGGLYSRRGHLDGSVVLGGLVSVGRVCSIASGLQA